MQNEAPLYKKWLWFMTLWITGFLSLAIIASIIRLVIGL